MSMIIKLENILTTEERLDLLKKAGAEIVINPLGRKFSEADLLEIIPDFDILIAGTEPITAAVLEKASSLFKRSVRDFRTPSPPGLTVCP